MTVLVTGGAGYIGSHMVWTLIEAGEDVVVIDNLSTGFRWALPPEVLLHKGDIGDRDLLQRVFKEHDVETIIHLAGSVVSAESVSQPLFYYKNNTSSSFTLIEQAVQAKVPHFIFSSTAAVYAPRGDLPLNEGAQLGPQSPYGMSKMMTEQMLCDAANAHPMNFAILRYFNVAGADPKGRTGQSTNGATHLIKVVCEAATGQRDHVAIYGSDWATPDGTGIRDFIHVSDLVDIHFLALQRLRGGGGNLVANCGYGRGHSVRQVIESVERLSGCSIPLEYAPRRPADVASVVADASLIQSELGWRPKRNDLDMMLGDALTWERRLAKKRAD